MIEVVIVDDQALVRVGFRSIVETDQDLEVMGEATNGREALQMVRQHQPDVVLMDVRMPEMDGIEATRAISDTPSLAETKVIIVTTFELDEYVFESLRAGAAGFLLKDTNPEDLIAAIKIVHEGEALLSPSVTRRLVAEFVSRTPGSGENLPDLDLLTPREREVMALVAAGLSNEEIAQEAYISTNTAKTHVSRAMTKLNARDRAQLVVFAYQSGLVSGTS